MGCRDKNHIGRAELFAGWLRFLSRRTNVCATANETERHHEEVKGTLIFTYLSFGMHDNEIMRRDIMLGWNNLLIAGRWQNPKPWRSAGQHAAWATYLTQYREFTLFAVNDRRSAPKPLIRIRSMLQ
jgi:hypothetical protein